jgi:hypothetical protein
MAQSKPGDPSPHNDVAVHRQPLQAKQKLKRRPPPLGITGRVAFSPLDGLLSKHMWAPRRLKRSCEIAPRIGSWLTVSKTSAGLRRIVRRGRVLNTVACDVRLCHLCAESSNTVEFFRQVHPKHLSAALIASYIRRSSRKGGARSQYLVDFGCPLLIAFLPPKCPTLGFPDS